MRCSANGLSGSVAGWARAGEIVAAANAVCRGKGFGKHRGARCVDGCLGVDPFAHPQGPLHDIVQRVSNGAGLFGAGVRAAQLTEDLRLANDHRVEPGGHREQVFHTGGREVHVEVLRHGVVRHRGLVGQYIDDLGQPVMKSCHHRVDLDAVAGAQQHCFRDVLTLEHRLKHLAGVCAGRGDPL